MIDHLAASEDWRRKGIGVFPEYIGDKGDMVWLDRDIRKAR